MHLRSEILKEHSKAQAEKIATWIGKHEDRFAELMQLFLHDEYRVVQRSAWIISIVSEKQPQLLYLYTEAMIDRMEMHNLPVAVKRNVVRVLQTIEMPEILHGRIMDLCFQFLADPAETIAVRCFSMTVLSNLSKYYPEIKPELKTIIEEGLQQNASAGFKARAKKILTKV